jgi:hypothetical protein
LIFLKIGLNSIGNQLQEETKMADEWAEELSCATRCSRCDKQMGAEDQRILSIYNHKAICMACKREEEQKPDYEEVSKQMIGQCLIDTEMKWGDPQGYCYHHFYLAAVFAAS